MIKFHLDKDVKLTFYDQIKGQLLSAIYCGKIKGGERIPSIRELSEDLKVNYKTVRKIYLRFAEENLVEIVPGSGAFLKERTGQETYDKMRRRAIFRLLGEVEDKARSLGLKPEQFAGLLNNFATGSNLKDVTLAVVDHEEEAFIFSRELRMRLQAKVFPVSLEAVSANGAQPAIERADYLLTTSWHMEEVGRLGKRYKKEVLEIKPSHEIYREIWEAAQNQNIAIVIQDERTMHASWDIFMNLYRPSTDREFWIAPIDREDLLEKILKEADVIFVSPMCWDEMRKRTPAEKELKTYENFISEETINNIRQLQLLG